MKRKNFTCLLYIVLAVCIANLTSCKDDKSYDPITLSLASEEGDMLTDDSITISLFCEGISFHILGGNGSYTIENSNTDLIDYRYDGNELTILPKALGNATLIISDRAGNTMSLQVTVAYPSTTYEIERIWGKAIGGNLTQSQTNAIVSDIESQSLVQAGGRYLFTYTNENLSEGMVTVYPSGTDTNLLHGIFTQTLSTDGTGTIYINLTGGAEYDFILADASDIMESTGTVSARVLMQDVTATYQKLYPDLEKAYCVQYIPTGTE